MSVFISQCSEDAHGSDAERAPEIQTNPNPLIEDKGSLMFIKNKEMLKSYVA